MSAAPIQIIDSAGPHCSTRFEDRRAEMLAPDYEPQTLPSFVVDEWRERELAAPSGEPLRRLFAPILRRPERQRAYAEVAAEYQRIFEALKDGTLPPEGPPWQSRPGPGG